MSDNEEVVGIYKGAVGDGKEEKERDVHEEEKYYVEKI